jgi:HEAT repeat protein
MTSILSSRTFFLLLIPLWIWGLATHANGEAPSKLAEYQQQYRDSNSQVRLHAVGLLGNLSSDAIPTLIEALRDDDRAVRHSAERALLKIGPASLPALDRMLDDSHFAAPHLAAHAIVWMGPAAAPTIMKVLEEYRPDAWNRLYESSNISNLPNETKSALVLKLVQLLRHNDNETRIRAMQYMGYMKPASEQALPHIIEALKSDKLFREKAAWVLYGIGKPATPFLVQALQDPNPDVRQFVVEMLTSPAFSREEATRGLQQVCTEDLSPSIRQRAQSILHQSFRKPPQSGC